MRLSIPGTAVATASNASARLVFCAALALLTFGCTTHPAKSPPPDVSGPTAACVARGGKYLGDMKCQMANGYIGIVLSGAEAAKSWESSRPVKPGSPNAWALATTAIIFEVNGESQELLAGEMVTPESEKGGKQLLANWWDVKNRDDLLEGLEWLQYTGHRAEFERLGHQVDAMSDQQFMTALAEDRANGQGSSRLAVVRQNYRQLGQRGILGWDLIRYVSLCRWGYLAGYLSEADAWKHIFPAALQLQQFFTSWQDLQTNYLIGREFWSPAQTQKDGDKFRAVYDRFIRDPGSPWNVNPWSMNLGDSSAPLPIKADSGPPSPPT